MARPLISLRRKQPRTPVDGDLDEKEISRLTKLDDGQLYLYAESCLMEAGAQLSEVRRLEGSARTDATEWAAMAAYNAGSALLEMAARDIRK
jgi:hypothetical protein